MPDNEDIGKEVKDAVEALKTGETPGTDETTDTNETAARKDGWVPKDDFKGDETNWVSADEFVRRKSLFEKIHNQGRELKKVREQMAALKGHHDKVYEDSYQKAVAELQEQRVTAIGEGDVQAVVAIENNLDGLKAEKAQAEAETAKENGPTEMFKEWVVDNSWYQDNPRMRHRADEVGWKYKESNPELPDEEVYDFVRERMEIEYPKAFEGSAETTTQRRKAPAVEGGADLTTPTTNRGTKSVQLTEEEKNVMNTLIRGGVMTKDEYMQEIAKLNSKS
jgi:hypothetical protein